MKKIYLGGQGNELKKGEGTDASGFPTEKNIIDRGSFPRVFTIFAGSDEKKTCSLFDSDFLFDSSVVPTILHESLAYKSCQKSSPSPICPHAEEGEEEDDDGGRAQRE